MRYFECTMTKHGNHKSMLVGTCLIAVPPEFPVDEEALENYFESADLERGAVAWDGWINDCLFKAFAFRELNRAQVAIRRGRAAEALEAEIKKLQLRLDKLPMIDFEVPEDFHASE